MNEQVLNNQTYLDADAWAKQILDQAGFPTDLNLVEAKGFREKKDIEWHAAAIRHQWSHINSLIVPSGGDFKSGRRNPISIIIRGPEKTLERFIAKLDRLITKAQILVDPRSQSARPGGKARGEQIEEEYSEEHAAIREAAAKLPPGLSKRKKAKLLQKKQFRHLSTETIRKLL